MNISKLIYYCRAGFEADMAAELDSHFAQVSLYGYSQLKAKQGFVSFNLYSPFIFESDGRGKFPVKFDELMFARQQLACIGNLTFESNKDRVGDILTFLNDLNINVPFGDVFCEHPETENGKDMAKFCKKFSVPLRQALRKHKRLSVKPNNGLSYLHLFFESSESCEVCLSFPKNRSNDYLGITRLKFPSEAPSRSTLKLEEAILKLLPRNSHKEILVKGMTAVDLGACPGGWTYQLVKRGIKVEAVDNGEIADSLMQTGLVTHFAHDGFNYQPQEGHVDWLVCDMIEKPDRVAALMTSWLVTRKTTSSIFNLKLPMQKRYAVVKHELDTMIKELNEKQIDFHMRAKHLYHDRDEITVAVVTGGHLI
ncbi:23S rRNA (cytidine(2498)-2'-O)-methyltransferase RlmM [Glaciecola sp. KUL10]|uniref:23S rRNA (cytidine(2498)-2'-O)-methyltransferase RlmM n=1 Tax=Glaciecola sp. (strain KUL10) TaxID=2161813 RepID=UPI000D78ACBD|nr:23S rRNA (cytidine(2498)-2'-O)-methyltransferase RlmM [Glaciecola sp. KUL10]GBL03130.1 RNA 2'-O-ribose methyltransferase [Glaciecola sp. KUL10]